MAKSRRNFATAQKASATDLRSFRTFLLMRQFAAQEIGERIKQARLEAGGMTQEELADALDVSTRSLQAYEAGDTIPWKHFQALTRIFDRPLEWFLHGEGPATLAPNGRPGSDVDVLRDEMVQGFASVQESLAAVLDRLEQLERGESDEDRRSGAK